MKIPVIYFSKFGNTGKVADTIAAVMSTAGSVHCGSLEELVPSDLKDYDLVIMGTPTHRMNLPEPVKVIFQSLLKQILRGTWVAAFDTSYKMSWLLSNFTASKRLIQALWKLGGKRIIKPETFHVTDREGPLYEGELGRARQWAEMILVKAGVRNIVPEAQRTMP